MPLSYSLEEGTLFLDSAALLHTVPATVSVLPDPRETGIFLRFHAEKAAARHLFFVGEWSNVVRFTACHRYEPF